MKNLLPRLPRTLYIKKAGFGPLKKSKGQVSERGKPENMGFSTGSRGPIIAFGPEDEPLPKQRLGGSRHWALFKRGSSRALRCSIVFNLVLLYVHIFHVIFEVGLDFFRGFLGLVLVSLLEISGSSIALDCFCRHV